MSEALFSQYEAWCEANGFDPRAPLPRERLPIRRLERGLFRFEPNFSPLSEHMRSVLAEATRLDEQDARRGAELAALLSSGDPDAAPEQGGGGLLERSLHRDLNGGGVWRAPAGLQDVAGDGSGRSECAAIHQDQLNDQVDGKGQHGLGKSFILGRVHRLVSLIGRAIKAAFRGRVE